MTATDDDVWMGRHRGCPVARGGKLGEWTRRGDSRWPIHGHESRHVAKVTGAPDYPAGGVLVSAPADESYAVAAEMTTPAQSSNVGTGSRGLVPAAGRAPEVSAVSW